MRSQGGDQARWEQRPRAATALRVVVFVTPVLLSFITCIFVRALLPDPSTLTERVVTWTGLAVVSTIVLVVVDRLARRILPLVALLDLSMLFPDRAPSRLKMARDAIRRRPIEEQLRRVQEAGADPALVAQAILALVAAMSVHDKPTRGHAERVRMFTDLLAQQMRVSERDRDLLRWASILHDIGKLRIPASLLNKPGKPTPEEWTLLKAHPTHGAEMAKALLPWLGEWGRVIAEHHERYDGTGYPKGISGQDISLGARIVSVADAYDVMTAARAYRRPVSRAAACRELVKFSGTQFDPYVVRAMIGVGAPKLRRAQGVVAWLANVPLVATAAVPAATVARVVGAGAMATGAATGGVVVHDTLEAAPRPEVAVTAAKEAGAAANAKGQLGAKERGHVPPGQLKKQDKDRKKDKVKGKAERSNGKDKLAGGRGNGNGNGKDKGGAGSGADQGSTGLEDQTGTVLTDEGSGQGRGSGKQQKDKGSGSGGTDAGGTQVEPAPSPSQDTGGGDLTGTVEDTVENTVDSVTGTVGDVAEDPVGTVEDTVEDPVGTVTGTVGGLLGGG